MGKLSLAFSPTNAQRVRGARRILSAFARQQGWKPGERMHADDAKDLLTDLLANLMHATAPDVFEAALSSARMHYESES